MNDFLLLICGFLIGLGVGVCLTSWQEEKRAKRTMEALNRIVKSQREFADKLRKMGL